MLSKVIHKMKGVFRLGGKSPAAPAPPPAVGSPEYLRDPSLWQYPQKDFADAVYGGHFPTTEWSEKDVWTVYSTHHHELKLAGDATHVETRYWFENGANRYAKIVGNRGAHMQHRWMDTDGTRFCAPLSVGDKVIYNEQMIDHDPMFSVVGNWEKPLEPVQ